MKFSLEPAYTCSEALKRLIVKAGSELENQWFFTDGSFNSVEQVDNCNFNNWINENFVVIYDQKIIAYFEAIWHRPLNVIRSFRLINFDKSKQLVVSMAFFKYLDYLFTNRGCEVFNWFVALKNTHAKDMYDRFIEKYCGREIGIKTRGQMSYNGTISDTCLYEITKDDYLNWKDKSKFIK